MRGARLAARIVAGLALAWTAGFAWFVHHTGQPAEVPAHADGIVALTGGADRVATALRLLAEGRAGRLLISGVGGTAEFNDLAHRAGVDAGLAPRVTLGRTASSTHGNAAETAEWVRAFRIDTLIVVTAGYHMPRALAELSRILPGVTLIPVPVQPTPWRDGIGIAGLRLLGIEYTKFLAVEAGLSGLVARGADRAAAPAAATEHSGG
jgi:uncharacterized SAM-binding protein YcdF (DUF218 family)